MKISIVLYWGLNEIEDVVILIEPLRVRTVSWDDVESTDRRIGVKSNVVCEERSIHPELADRLGTSRDDSAKSATDLSTSVKWYLARNGPFTMVNCDLLCGLLPFRVAPTANQQSWPIKYFEYLQAAAHY